MIPASSEVIAWLPEEERLLLSGKKNVPLLLAQGLPGNLRVQSSQTVYVDISSKVLKFSPSLIRALT